MEVSVFIVLGAIPIGFTGLCVQGTVPGETSSILVHAEDDVLDFCVDVFDLTLKPLAGFNEFSNLFLGIHEQSGTQCALYFFRFVATPA